MRLGSQELADEFFRRQKEDPECQEKLKGLTIRLLLLGTDALGAQDRQLAINLQGGRFVSVVPDIRPAPSELRTLPFDKTRYDARVIAPQETLIDLIKGRIDLADALGKVQIEGDLTYLMSQFEGFQAFITFISSMDIEP